MWDGDVQGAAAGGRGELLVVVQPYPCDQGLGAGCPSSVCVGERRAGLVGVMLVQPKVGAVLPPTTTDGIADPPRWCWFAGICSGRSPCSRSAPLQTPISVGERLGAAGWCLCCVSHPCRVVSSTPLGLRRVPAAPGATQRGAEHHSPTAGVFAPAGDKGDFSVFNESTAMDSLKYFDEFTSSVVYLLSLLVCCFRCHKAPASIPCQQQHLRYLSQPFL